MLCTQIAGLLISAALLPMIPSMLLHDEHGESLSVPLTEELFFADADTRRDNVVPPDAVLRGACVIRGAVTPAFRLHYVTPLVDGEHWNVCVWRPWRVGTYVVLDECEC